MSSVDLDQLIDRCIDGDAEGRAELEALLRHSPDARRAWWRAMQVHAGLGGALRARSAAMSGAKLRSPSRSRKTATPRNAWLLVTMAAAAAIVLVVLGIQTQRSVPTVTPLASITVGTGSGRILNAGDDVVAADATTVAISGEATTLRLAVGSHLRLDRHDGIALTLSTGAMSVEAAPQPADQPLRVTTPHAELRVIGTAFHIAVDSATDLRVEHGTVAVRTGDTDVRVEAGGQLRCRPGEPLRQGTALVRLIDDFTGDLAAWNNNSRGGLDRQLVGEGFLDNDGYRLRFTPTAAVPSPWTGMRFTQLQDWRSASGISLAISGTGGGGLLEVEVLDDGPWSGASKGDAAERFVTPVRDDHAGWRELRLPFKSFTRRALQRPGAPDNGLTLSAVQGLTLIQEAPPLDVVVDRLGLYRE
ncbi:MAG: carbohydrate binding domain-containing protein [Planctomycetota bacterium]